jgi:hypothetical protein
VFPVDEIPATIVEGKKEHGLRFFGIPGIRILFYRSWRSVSFAIGVTRVFDLNNQEFS